MAQYKTKHVIQTPAKQYELGAHVNASDLGNQAEIDRLLRLGAIEPLEGYTAPEPRPDQGTDTTPRGVVSPDWFAGALTPEEIDTQIAALQAQREAAVATQQKQAEIEKASEAANTEAARRGRPPVSKTAQV